MEAISANRQMEPVRLTRLIRDDLDWLVMKALAKDRNGRYDSASSLAADVNRFLAGQPIDARPPSPLYRLRKSVHQHRTAWIAASLVFASLLSGVAISTFSAYRTHRVLMQLRSELTSVALNAVFRGNHYEAADAIKRAETAGTPPDLVQTLRGVSQLIDGNTDEAIRLLEAASSENIDSIKTNAALFWAYWQASSSGKMDKVRDRSEIRRGPAMTIMTIYSWRLCAKPQVNPTKYGTHVTNSANSLNDTHSGESRILCDPPI